jgi:hypothetical protein
MAEHHVGASNSPHGRGSAVALASASISGATTSSTAGTRWLPARGHGRSRAAGVGPRIPTGSCSTSSSRSWSSAAATVASPTTPARRPPCAAAVTSGSAWAWPTGCGARCLAPTTGCSGWNWSTWRSTAASPRRPAATRPPGPASWTAASRASSACRAAGRRAGGRRPRGRRDRALDGVRAPRRPLAVRDPPLPAPAPARPAGP